MGLYLVYSILLLIYGRAEGRGPIPGILRRRLRIQIQSPMQKETGIDVHCGGSVLILITVHTTKAY